MLDAVVAIHDFPNDADVVNLDDGLCYDQEDAVCGRPGDDTFVVCGATSKGVAKISVCVDGQDGCKDFVRVDPSICGECP